ncbi:hypothetical protein Scep_007965 [Stephania cephalantha]|uniref:Uncharacterized protein n=1 Tax=Stephania cephalantha TaxID=152367 RepID=A0AAP0KCL1_9MAGN
MLKMASLQRKVRGSLLKGVLCEEEKEQFPRFRCGVGDSFLCEATHQNGKEEEEEEEEEEAMSMENDDESEHLAVDNFEQDSEFDGEEEDNMEEDGESSPDQNQNYMYDNMEVSQSENSGNDGGKLSFKENYLPRTPLPTNEEHNGNVTSPLGMKVSPITETFKCTSLKTEVSSMIKNECSMLKEEIANLFTQTMDKVEDRFGTRMVHNYRLAKDRVAAVERHISEHGSKIKRAVAQMKAQLSGWNVLPTIGQPSSKASDK